jgi:molybdate transport system regulatory protein
MARRSLLIRGALSLETKRGGFANQRWMELLASIERSHSISAAARAVGLSYKAAWDAVETMNNLADEPLVERSVGGRGGGGTRLTKRGSELIATYARVAAEHERFLARINERVGDVDRDLRLFGRLAMLTSARNHFAGTIKGITRGAVNDVVELELIGGDTIVAVITHGSVENLGLKVGVEAFALVKASWVIVATGKPGKLSARNRLDGTIAKVETGAVNSEVVITLKGGTSVAAIITNESAKALGLAVGKPASAIIKASSVIIGVAA